MRLRLDKAMLKPSKNWILPILVIVIGIFWIRGLLYWLESRTPPVTTSVYKQDSFAFNGTGDFKGINGVTERAGLPELRKVHVKKGDIEIRIWRIGRKFEGVLLERVDGIWSALYLDEIYDKVHYQIPTAHVTRLRPPISGWTGFWDKLSIKAYWFFPRQRKTSVRRPITLTEQAILSRLTRTKRTETTLTMLAPAAAASPKRSKRSVTRSA